MKSFLHVVFFPLQVFRDNGFQRMGVVTFNDVNIFGLEYEMFQLSKLLLISILCLLLCLILFYEI